MKKRFSTLRKKNALWQFVIQILQERKSKKSGCLGGAGSFIKMRFKLELMLI
jgi:hypothetical protein